MTSAFPDLNCDLAEGEPLALTQALLAHISSANIACGVHAGSPTSIHSCIQFALPHHVHIGAHPGLPSQFGRGPVHLSPDSLFSLLVEQCRTVQQIAQSLGAPLHHIKLHGSLYHATDLDPHLRSASLHAVQQFPGARLYARAGGPTLNDCLRLNIPAWAEIFADRNYLPDGSLVPRSHPLATLSDPNAVRSRIQRWLSDQTLVAIDGTPLHLPAQTLCIHSDTPNALSLARTVGECLRLPSHPHPASPQLESSPNSITPRDRAV